MTGAPSLLGTPVPTVGEFWTARQRQASSLHEVSYRACFKPQLPAYFIDRYTEPGGVVLDPFSGRGTTAVEAALRGRAPVANDVNPLSAILARPRLEPPTAAAVEERLDSLRLDRARPADRDLSMFFHPDTLGEIVSLKDTLARRASEGAEDAMDRWIRMTATNRLTGHSVGFFSVYTLPPNQAASPESQVKINAKLGQTPEYRDVKKLLLKKTLRLLRDVTDEVRERLRSLEGVARFLTGDAADLAGVADGSVDLTVTSPPFLDVVNYAADNWLRNWFNGIDGEAVARRASALKSVEDWSRAMAAAFRELFRVARPGGRVAFEVGEVRRGSVRLEEVVVPLGRDAGFQVESILINTQAFTKTAHLWGVDNNAGGTNTNRIVLFRKPGGTK